MTAKPRILLAGLFHETHTFLEGETGWDDFEVTVGEKLRAVFGDASPMGGFLEVAEKNGWEVAPAIDARAQPGPTVADEVFERYWTVLESRVAESLGEGVDAVFLVLHGAMAISGIPDVEGELLRRLRALDGLAEVPVFGVYDLHANFSEAMAALADGLVAYRENPHADAREAAVRAAGLLERCLATGVVPRMQMKGAGIVWPPTGTATADDPMRLLERKAREFEAENESLWAVNVNAGFAYADTAETGVSFSVVHAGASDQAEDVLRDLSGLAWSNRESGCNSLPSPDEVLSRLKQKGFEGVTVITEPSDNIGGGAPGDGTGLLRALVRHRVPRAAICINDPAAVHTLESSAPGSEVSLRLGGKGSCLDPGPLEIEVKLESLHDGRFRLEDPRSHLASMCGDEFDMGRCAVVRHGGLTILVTSVKTPPFDLGQWRSQGLEPSEFRVIGVKAAVAHRRAYDAIGARHLAVETPGPCSSDLAGFPWRRLSRPVYPLDA